MPLYIAEVHGSPHDEFGNWKLDRSRGVSLMNTAVGEKIHIHLPAFKLDEFKTTSISSGVQTIDIPNDVGWGVNSFTGAPIIRNIGDNDNDIPNPRMMVLMISPVYKVLDYKIGERTAIFHTFKRGKTTNKNIPRMGCIMNVPALPGTIIAELVVQNMRSKGRFEKIIISKESSGIKVRKMRSKEIDTAADRLNKGIDIAHMSFRVNNPALTTSVIVYDSSSFKGRLGSDYANKILVDIAGLSIKQAIDKINTFAEQKYRYRLKAIAFCSPISLDIREIVKCMKIDYAYNLIVTKYHTRIFNLRSK